MKNTKSLVNFSSTKFYTIIALLFCFVIFGFANNAHATVKKKTFTKTTVTKTKVAKATKAKSTKTVSKKVMATQRARAMSLAAPRAQTQRFPASLSTGISDSQKSLEIRGQSRNLSMLLVLKNRHENIDFVKPRESYREEIPQTEF